jgi:hypothetical protein
MRSFAAFSILLALTATASADDSVFDIKLPTYMQMPRGNVEAAAPGDISNIIFVNKCVGGCTVTKSGVNNAITNESFIPDGNDGQSFQITQFAYTDDVWNAVIECVRDVYSPYNVEVVTEDPGEVAHHEVIAAGLGEEINRGDTLGVGGGGGGCGEPSNNGMSFAFLNEFPQTQVEMMCQVIAQESAHSFGLPDHLYDCTDPMTYLTLASPNGCPRRYFRNRPTPCGEFERGVPGCQCGGASVNSHVILLGVFGPGQTPAPPTVAITTPTEGGSLIDESIVIVDADSVRGIDHVELYLNGWLWATERVEGPFEPPFSYPTNFTLDPEGNFPDGVIDIEVRAYDDLGTMTSATVRATKGSPCTDASQCLAGQTCDGEGRCLWPQPVGELGDACENDEYCIGPAIYDGKCIGVNGEKVCVRDCYSGVNDDCPEGFYCEETNANLGTGVCIAGGGDDGGCCSTSRGGSPVGVLLLGGVLGLYWVGARRRRPVAASR